MQLKMFYLKISLFVFFLLTIQNFEHLQGQELLPDIVWTRNNLGGRINVVKFSPDSQYIFASTSYYGVHQLDRQTGEIIRTIMLGNNQVSFSSTSDTIVLSAGNQISLISTRSGDILDTIILPFEGFLDCAGVITPNGKSIIATTGKIGKDYPQIFILDIETKEIIKTFVGKYVQTSQLNISPDGKYFYFSDFAGARGFVFLIDLNTYEEIAMFDNSPYGIMTPTISPDNTMLACISYVDGKILIYDLKTFKLRKVINYSEPNTTDFGLGNAIFSNDSKYLIFGYYDHEEYDPNEVIVWNIEKDMVEYKFQFSGVSSIDISQDDFIVTVGYSPTKIWHVNLLRPNWKISKVKESKEVKLKYSYQDGKLKVLFDENIFEKPGINIYDLEGKLLSYSQLLITNFQTGSNSLEIDFSLFPSGIYFVEIISGNNKYTIKVIKN
jgi:WD40 repeat protein